MSTSYLTVEEAQEIADERLNVDAWEDAKETDGSDWGESGTLCVKALLMATKIIDGLDYRGAKTVSTQEHAFPRGEDTTVPTDINLACFEIALALLDGVDPQLEADNISIVSQGFANVRSTHDNMVPLPNKLAGVPSVTAWKYLSKYLNDPNQLTLLRS